MAVGPYAVSAYCMEAKKAQAEAMIRSKEVILQVAREFEEISGRGYGLFEEYQMEDAEYAVVAIGSVCGTTKDAIDRLREQGVKAGLVKVRVFRPFPGEELAEALKGCNRAKATAETVNIVYGLSGRDVRVEDMMQVYEDLKGLAEGRKTFEQYPYLGLRE